MVPRDRVARLRMKLAEGGLPKGGGVGYEIFDQSDTLGATSFVQNINHLRALEGELARTIRAIDRVQMARVHLVLPERQLFSRDKAGGRRRRSCSRSAACSSRSRCAPSAISSRPPSTASSRSACRSSTRPAGCWPTAPAATTPWASPPTSARLAYERRLREQVEAIVTSVVGPGRARVQLTADFDFNRVTQTSEQIRSGRPRRALEPDARGIVGNSGNGQDQVTVGNELPGAPAAPPSRTRRQRQPAARPVATRPRRSSTTRFPTRPRPK